MGVHHLRSVVAVADHQSFTTAAETLGVAQSSLSRTIAEVERRLGVRLFERTTRKVVATGDGREVAAHARRILTGFDDGLREIEGFITGDRGSVTVACLPSLAATFLPPYVRAFRESHPQVRLRIRDGLREEVLTSVRAGAVELALVSLSGPIEGLRHERITADSFFCAVPPGHRFADRDTLNWADLAGEPFIAFGPESSIEGPVRRALDEAGAELGTVVQAQNVGAVAGLVAAGLGITAVPELVLPMISFAGLVHIPLTPVVERSISLVWLADRYQSASAKAFARQLRAATASAKPGT
ncbi:transcriptional regulator [Actinoalloteichus hymeniacidonis]|uniref:Transcriptional regulator n=1 Tax=Actinoalloteichus hymeniacidonis TaxID=340345 RepID=A0AAC9HS82_9PSEU|nr:transcriptional regulator [Actinoalloteichus hymeniacidonis]